MSNQQKQFQDTLAAWKSREKSGGTVQTPSKEKKQEPARTPAADDPTPREQLVRRLLLSLQQQQSLYKQRATNPDKKGEIDPQLKKLKTQDETVMESIVVDENISDMVHQHCLSFSKLAAANEMVVVWRPVNPESAAKLDSKSSTPYMAKGMVTKGKSSNYGPIAGDIPVQAVLSKVSSSDVEKFQAKNDKALKDAQLEIDVLKEKASRDPTVYEKINDGYFVCKKNKDVEIEGQRAQLYYLSPKTGRGQKWFQEKGYPLFLVKKPTTTGTTETIQWLAYEEDASGSKSYKDFHATEFDGEQPQPVEIMAYYHYESPGSTRNASDKWVEERYPITADYDELVSAARRIYPLDLNPSIPTEYDKETSEELRQIWSGAKGPKEVGAKVEALLIFNHALKLRKKHRTLMVSPAVGSVNEQQQVMIGHLSAETQGAKNHGSEVNNPFPEPLSDGRYAAYLPTGKVIILKNEEDICAFINAARAEGFPLDVNPRWGWKADAKGQLFLPPSAERINWKKISHLLAEKEEEISKMKKMLGTPEGENIQERYDMLKDLMHKKQDSNPSLWRESLTAIESSLLPLDEGQAQQLFALVAAIAKKEEQYIADKMIIDKAMEIESLSLEPKIIYSAWGPEGTVTTPEEEEFRKAVMPHIQKKETEWRKEQIGNAQTSLEVRRKDYMRNYDNQSPIWFEVEEERVLAKKQDQKTSLPPAEPTSRSTGPGPSSLGSPATQYGGMFRPALAASTQATTGAQPFDSVQLVGSAASSSSSSSAAVTASAQDSGGGQEGGGQKFSTSR